VSINIGHEGQILTTTFENNWYWYYETLFWPEQIMRIREICEKSEEEEALTYGIENPVNANHTIRKNKVSWHDNEELYSIIRPTIDDVNQQSGWNYNITAIEPFQYTVYYGDQNHYHWHTDTIVNDRTLSPDYPEDHILKNTVRKISCSIQLTDPSEYDGGEFELLSLKEKKEENREEQLNLDGYNVMEPIKLPHFKEKGSALFFPSFTYHRVKPVTNGIRRSLVIWLRGPKWQ
jgi:PKHD-type hydroxylase